MRTLLNTTLPRRPEDLVFMHFFTKYFHFARSFYFHRVFSFFLIIILVYAFKGSRDFNAELMVFLERNFMHAPWVYFPALLIEFLTFAGVLIVSSVLFLFALWSLFPDSFFRCYLSEDPIVKSIGNPDD